MIRRALALLLAATLVLGSTGVSAATPCAETAKAATASGEGCKSCGGAGDQSQSNCAALACGSACATGPMVVLGDHASRISPISAGAADSPPRDDGAMIRSIRPDLPPPR